MLGALRKAARKANAWLPLTPEPLEGSLEESLRPLGTDRVEFYALHAAVPDLLAREEVFASGKARGRRGGRRGGGRSGAGGGRPLFGGQLPQPVSGAPDTLLPRFRIF